MTSENVVNVDVTGPCMLIILSDTKLLKNNSFSTTRKFIGVFVTGFLLTMSFLLILGEIFDIKNSYDLPTFASRMNPICFHLSGSVKWILGMSRVDDIEELMNRMKRCHRLCLKINENDKGHHSYHKKIIKVRREMSIFAFGYFTLLIYGVIQWCLNPVFYDFYNDIYGVKEFNSSFSRHLPFPGAYPWRVDNISKYIGTFIFQAISGLGSAIGHGVYDILNITLLAYVCFHFEYLNETLVDRYDNTLILSDDLAERKFANKLRNCLIHHREILEFLEKLTRTASTPLFIICSQSTLALCLVSLEASTMKIDSSMESIMTASSLVEYWSGININLFIYCYFATKIQELGLTTADAIYSCDWEHTVKSSRNQFKNPHNEHSRIVTSINQMVQISVMRAQKPIIMNGGLFYILSLETYKALMGFSLSNALILRQVSEE